MSVEVSSVEALAAVVNEVTGAALRLLMEVKLTGDEIAAVSEVVKQLSYWCEKARFDGTPLEVAGGAVAHQRAKLKDLARQIHRRINNGIAQCVEFDEIAREKVERIESALSAVEDKISRLDAAGVGGMEERRPYRGAVRYYKSLAYNRQMMIEVNMSNRVDRGVMIVQWRRLISEARAVALICNAL